MLHLTMPQGGVGVGICQLWKMGGRCYCSSLIRCWEGKLVDLLGLLLLVWVGPDQPD